MKFYLTFVKLPFVYMVVNAPNKTIAINQVSKYRNDIVAYGDESKFSFSQAIEFKQKWQEVGVKYLETECNTRKKFKLTKKDRSVLYVELREDELSEYCRSLEPKGQFFTTEGQRFFVVKQKKEHNLVFAINEVKSIPKLLEDKDFVSLTGKRNLVEPTKKTTEIEVEVV